MHNFVHTMSITLIYLTLFLTRGRTELPDELSQHNLNIHNTGINWWLLFIRLPLRGKQPPSNGLIEASTNPAGDRHAQILGLGVIPAFLPTVDRYKRF